GDRGIEGGKGRARAGLGNRVRLVHRGKDFGAAKRRNRTKIQRTIEQGRLGVFFNAAVQEVREHSVLVKTATGVQEIPNDFVFVMVGGENPKKFLSECGIEFSNRSL